MGAMLWDRIRKFWRLTQHKKILINCVGLQQSVQNPIIDNTIFLWNSPSLRKKNTAIGYPWFYKTTHFLFLKEKTGSNSSMFSGIAHYLGCANKTAKNQFNCIVLNFN